MDFKLYNDDCFNVFPLIPDKSVDAIICDLPYGTTACTWDSILPFDKLWEQYERIIKDKGAIVLMANQPFTSKLVCSNIDLFKHEWIWDKHIARNFQVAKYRPMSRHESILVFGKGSINYYPIMKQRQIPVRVKNYGNSKSNPLANNDGHYRVYDKIYPDTIIDGKWEANGGKKHPTQKPVSLMQYLISTYTKETETILDNCMGSGTTGVACKLTNRKFIGIEKEPEYFKIAQKRISETQAGGLFFNSNTSNEL